jgi:hypothetical protein
LTSDFYCAPEAKVVAKHNKGATTFCGVQVWLIQKGNDRRIIAKQACVGGRWTVGDGQGDGKV